MKVNLKGLFTIVAVAIVVSAILYGILNFNRNVYRELESSATETLVDTANQQQLSVEREFEIKQTLIVNIANTFALLGSDKEAVLEYMQNVERDFKLDTIILSEVDGRASLSDNTQVNISEMSYYDDVLKNEEVVTSQPYISPYTGNEVIAVAAPIFTDGTPRGIIVAEYDIEYIESLLSASYTDYGYTLIIQPDGEIVIDSTKEDFDEKFAGGAHVMGDTSSEELNGSFANMGSGSFIFGDGTNINFAEYRSLSINDWILLTIVEEEEINQSLAQISASMVIVSVIIIACFAVFILYILLLRRQNMEKIEKIAYYDELTGLRNLVKFKIDIAEMLEKKSDTKFVIAKLDIVNFKAVNEVFDYEVGNSVLRAVASICKMIKEETFICARVGPDEFMIFSGNGFLEKDDMHSEHYEKILKSLLPNLDKFQFSFRFGRYYIEQGERDINDIINKTTMAHSVAKSAIGVTNIYDYDDKIKQRVLKHTKITNSMEEALENGEFKVFLQPKYSISSNRIIGAEALVRWIEADGNMVYPNDFIPLFESNGFIIELDKYMLSSVCCLLKEWIARGFECIPVSVNFSRMHLSNENFVSEIQAITDKYGVPRKYIEIEFTETCITQNGISISDLLDDLHKLGFAVSIDDFGAGYSSLGMLKNFKVETLKLDRSFFISNKDDERGNIVVESVINLAHSLGMYTVAEGVETVEQVEFLKKINCEAAQGYLYAKPMPTTNFEELCYGE